MAGDESGINGDESQSEIEHSQLERDGGQPKLEALLEVLTSRRRRYTLYYLQDQEVTDLDSLAAHLASIEQDIPISALSDDQIDRFQAQLLHADLPALADAQLLEFDRRSEAIRYAEPPPLLNGLLRLCAEIDAPAEQPD